MAPGSPFRVLYAAMLLSFHLSSQSLPRYARQLLQAHNASRARYGEPPLIWSAPLAQRSEEWAMLLIEKGRFEPRRDGVYGENLFESNAPSLPENVVAAWMAERSNYHESNNTCSARCGHFTQVVWRDTRLVGCGVAHSRTREVWVCNYDPPGNFRGERPY